MKTYKKNLVLAGFIAVVAMAASSLVVGQTPSSSQRLMVYGDTVYFYGASPNPANCTESSRYKKGDPIGFRMTVLDPATGKRDRSTQVVLHLTYNGKTVDLPMRDRQTEKQPEREFWIAKWVVPDDASTGIVRYYSDCQRFAGPHGRIQAVQRGCVAAHDCRIARRSWRGLRKHETLFPLQHVDGCRFACGFSGCSRSSSVPTPSSTAVAQSSTSPASNNSHFAASVATLPATSRTAAGTSSSLHTISLRWSARAYMRQLRVCRPGRSRPHLGHGDRRLGDRGLLPFSRQKYSETTSKLGAVSCRCERDAWSELHDTRGLRRRARSGCAD